MTIPIFLLVSVAGGFGAAARLVVDSLVAARLGNRYPFGTTLINITGSFLLGLVVGLAGEAAVLIGMTGLSLTGASDIPHDLRLVLGTGLLGGYTTFSTASFDTVRLLRARRYAAAVANGVGMLVVSVLAAVLGLLVASSLI